MTSSCCAIAVVLALAAGLATFSSGVLPSGILAVSVGVLTVFSSTASIVARGIVGTLRQRSNLLRRRSIQPEQNCFVWANRRIDQPILSSVGHAINNDFRNVICFQQHVCTSLHIRDIGDHAEREWGIECERLCCIDTVLILTRLARPFRLEVVLLTAHLSDVCDIRDGIGHGRRAEHDRPGGHVRMKNNAHERAAAHRVLVEIRADCRARRERRHLSRACVEVKPDQVAAAVLKYLLCNVLELLRTDVNLVRRCLVLIPEPAKRLVDLNDARCLVCRQPRSRRHALEIAAILDDLRQIAVNDEIIRRPILGRQVFCLLRSFGIGRDCDTARRRDRAEFLCVLCAPEPRIRESPLCRRNDGRDTVRRSCSGRHVRRIRLLRSAAAVNILRPVCILAGHLCLDTARHVCRMIALEGERCTDDRDFRRGRKRAARRLCRKGRRLCLAEFHGAVAAEQHLLLADDDRLEQILCADRAQIVKSLTLKNGLVGHEVFKAERLVECERILRLNRDHTAALPLGDAHRHAVDIDARDCLPVRRVATAALDAGRRIAQRREHRIHEARGRLQVIVLETAARRKPVRLLERCCKCTVQRLVHACQCLLRSLIHTHFIILHHSLVRPRTLRAVLLFDAVKRVICEGRVRLICLELKAICFEHNLCRCCRFCKLLELLLECCGLLVLCRKRSLHLLYGYSNGLQRLSDGSLYRFCHIIGLRRLFWVIAALGLLRLVSRCRCIGLFRLCCRIRTLCNRLCEIRNARFEFLRHVLVIGETCIDVADQCTELREVNLFYLIFHVIPSFQNHVPDTAVRLDHLYNARRRHTRAIGKGELHRAQCVACRRTVLPPLDVIAAKAEPRVDALTHLAPFAIIHNLDADIDCFRCVIKINRTNDFARRYITVHRADIAVIGITALLCLLR
nr:MAG TPA: hypothetical protein [Caudoviricetes sp.]